MYLALCPKDKLSEEEARSKMMDFSKDIKAFITAIKKKQNDDNTEFFIIGNSCQRKHMCSTIISTYVMYNSIQLRKIMCVIW